MLLQKNWQSGLTVIIVFLFFSQTFSFTWECASPFVQADDWRFITLYLDPLYKGQFHFKDLWADHVHPLPVYALFFIGSAKFLGLQMHYIGRVAICFQLILGIFIAFSYIKSIAYKKTISALTILAVISLSTIIFSFIVHTPYTWPIMTLCFFGSSFLLIIAHFSDRYYHRTKIIEYKSFFLIGIVLLFSYLFFSDWTVIFTLSLLFVSAIIFWMEKLQRIKIALLSLTLIIFLGIGYLLLTYYLRENHRSIHVNITGFILLMGGSPVLMLKSISIGLLSGIINFVWFSNLFESGKETYVFLSLIFIFTYLFVLVVFFTKRLYNRSILPPVMMIYSLAFILSVLLTRYNPVENGIFCLYWDRYIQFYQIGIIGYLWSLFLIFNTLAINKPRFKKIIMVLGYSITSILVILWANDYYYNKNITSVWLKSIYPIVSNEIRDKLNNNEIQLRGIARPYAAKDISQQLKFLKDYQLNVFAPDYPYSKGKDTKDEPMLNQ